MTDDVWQIVLGELDEKMGVTILEQSAERVVATMPVEGNRQSFGLLHGGASVAFAEAIGSWAAVIHARSIGKSAVGLDINATHHASATSGIITGIATAVRLGKTVTSHEIVVSDDQGRRLCTARITNLLIDAPPPR
ncbi:MAG: hotdog fold thioesterase [Pseudolysinimonas sp.]